MKIQKAIKKMNDAQHIKNINLLHELIKEVYSLKLNVNVTQNVCGLLLLRNKKIYY